MAVAAFVDEVTKIMNGGRGEPARVAILQRLEQVVWLLGGRMDPMNGIPCT